MIVSVWFSEPERERERERGRGGRGKSFISCTSLVFLVFLVFLPHYLPASAGDVPPARVGVAACPGNVAVVIWAPGSSARCAPAVVVGVAMLAAGAVGTAGAVATPVASAVHGAAAGVA